MAIQSAGAILLDNSGNEPICAALLTRDGNDALPCGAISGISPEIETVTKLGWGGVRPGAGRPRKVWTRPVLREITGPRWYCAQVYPRAEEQVVSELERKSFETHLPRERAVIVRRGLREIVVRPFFPGYLFVRFDTADNWRPVAHTVGLRRLFGATPEHPRPVPGGVIEALIMRTGADGIIDSRPESLKLSTIQIGTSVRLIDGPFADMTAVCQWSQGDRVKLLLDVMGGKVSATVPRDLVEVVDGQANDLQAQDR